MLFWFFCVFSRLSEIFTRKIYKIIDIFQLSECVSGLIILWSKWIFLLNGQKQVAIVTYTSLKKRIAHFIEKLQQTLNPFQKAVLLFLLTYGARHNFCS